MRKSLNIGVFNPQLIYQASPYCGDNIFAKGLEENGFEVTRFDYRATNDANDDLVRLAMSMKVKPDIVWIGKAERILPISLNVLRQVFPDAVFIKWAADVRDEPTVHDMGHMQYIDWFFGTFGGSYLKKHLLPSMKGVGSIIAFTDSSFYKRIDTVPEEWKTDVVWTGRRSIGNNELRNQTIDRLLKYENTKVHGLSNWLGNPEYLYAINGAKIGVGVNSYKHTSKWSSDRLGNYMACGTFYLCHDFGGIDEIFKRGYHLDWFQDIEEMDEKIKYYLEHDDIRKDIARNGQEFILKYFDTKPLVNNLLHVIKHSESKYPWDDVYTN